MVCVGTEITKKFCMIFFFYCITCYYISFLKKKTMAMIPDVIKQLHQQPKTLSLYHFMLFVGI